MFVLDQAGCSVLLVSGISLEAYLDRLISLATRPNITIEVVPFSAGLHSGRLNIPDILEVLTPEDSDVLFVETSRDMIVSHDEAGEIGGYLEVFGQLRSISLVSDGSLAFLVGLIKQIS